MNFRGRGGGAVGHPQGAQGKAPIFRILVIPGDRPERPDPLLEDPKPGSTPKTQDPEMDPTFLIRTYIRKLKCIFQFWLILGRFPAKVGPGTVTNGPGLKHAANINDN